MAENGPLLDSPLGILNQAEEEGGSQSSAPVRRAGKEIAEPSMVEKKHVLVINMTGAREARRPQFLAVGLFLSDLLVSSKQLIDHMKKVWKIRGVLEVSSLESDAGRKFLLVFSEEGDQRHAIVGGPWNYKGDAFLVEGLAEDADPSSALFTHVPMWMQFRKIPFYLLTKKLAFDLGECIGKTMRVDNEAWGLISEKFVRTRVQLPLYRALRKEILLADEITGEEVAVQLRYERVPNFCLFCGFIGHMEARCDVPKAERRIEYNQNLRVLPVHFEFPQSWSLPDAMGQASSEDSAPRLWHAPTPATPGERHDTAGKETVEQVVAEVARLSVVENHEKDREENTSSDNKHDNKQISPTDEKEKMEDDNQTTQEVTDKKRKISWKRKAREEMRNQSDNPKNVVNQSVFLAQGAGNVRSREERQVEENGVEPAAKKTAQQSFPAADGHSKDGLKDKKGRKQTTKNATGKRGENVGVT
ncbi:hypothetical protein C2845_PM13G05710 [Panicum miliaceum]|uniref:Zinc knuckle CX2CX4HX4C domain-containing protein n=1 Tax=Panicum miliaceum TaxID=4540 RepID=A0A3L6RH34_PANMI|nr:hypothetical protein C2845_PM13G05710 [Panicum miliaceum]